MVELSDNVALHRFEMSVDGQTAFVTYAITNGWIVLIHTEVPDALAGRGVGGALVRAVLEEARRRGVEVVPRCEFAAAYIHRHPEFAGLVASLPIETDATELTDYRFDLDRFCNVNPLTLGKIGPHHGTKK
jgi:uncharacterized protein